MELVDQVVELARRAYLSDANQSAEVRKCRRELVALLREMVAPLQLQQQSEETKDGDEQLSIDTFSAQSSHA